MVSVTVMNLIENSVDCILHDISLRSMYDRGLDFHIWWWHNSEPFKGDNFIDKGWDYLDGLGFFSAPVILF